MSWQSVAQQSVGVAFSLDYADNQVIVATSNSYTFTAMGLGAANGNRVIGVYIGWRQTVTATDISSMTIGGVSATKIAGSDTESVSAFQATRGEIWYASVPTGTTGDVVVTWANNVSRAYASTYRIITGTATPTSAAAGAATSGASIAASVTVPAGGAAMNGGFTQNGSGGTVSWTNATSDNSNNSVGGLSTAGVAKATATATVTYTSSTSSSSTGVSSASWGP